MKKRVVGIWIFLLGLILVPSAFAATAISTCQQLQNINNNLAGDYYLINDIDCSGFNFQSIGEGCEYSLWGVPWCENRDCFEGDFDGRGYTISNLKITRTDEYSGGLFACTYGTSASHNKIEDIALENVNIYSKDMTGGLAGSMMYTDINRIYIEGEIEGEGDEAIGVGGIAGVIYMSKILNSYSNVDVKGENSVGGILGIGTYSGYVKNSYSKSTVYASARGGGLIGYTGGASNSKFLTQNSFAASVLSNQGNGLIGYQHGYSNRDNVYWVDVSSSDAAEYCTFSDENWYMDCPEEGLEDIYDSTHEIYDDWDFDNDWKENEDDLPTLIIFEDCEPTTCSSLGKECGYWGDGCGNQLSCGNCGTNEVCSAGICESTCTDSCSSLGYECGTQEICGEEINCGTCGSGEVCNLGVCVSSCTDSCSSLGYECGNHWICGVYANCGNCPIGSTSCVNGKCKSCVSECSSGEKRCIGDYLQSCEIRDLSGCYSWPLFGGIECEYGCLNGDCLECEIDNDCDVTEKCEDGFCQEDLDCVVDPDCDDNNACTEDKCETGFCYNTAKNCDDEDLCTTDSCDTSEGCINEEIDCGENSHCEGGVCIDDSIAHWANMMKTYIRNAEVGDSVLLMLEETGLSEGTIVEFEIYEDDLTFDDYIGTVNGQVNSEGIAIAKWVVDITDGSGNRVDSDSDAEFYFEAMGEKSGELIVDQSSYDNSLPETEIVNPEKESNYIILGGTTGEISFEQISIDEDDDLNLIWNFGDGSEESFENILMTGLGNTTHDYYSAGAKLIELTVKEVGRDQSNRDLSRIFVYQKGWNIFAIIDEPHYLDKIKAGVHKINGSSSKVVYCTETISECSTESGDISRCYEVSDARNDELGFVDRTLYCYNYAVAGDSGFGMKWYFDSEEDVTKENQVSFYKLFLEPREHTIDLSVYFEII